MDKKKQIEEMARIIDGDCGECYTCKYFESKGINCTYLLGAEYLYNAGYRKIPENAVVLTVNEEVDRWIDLLVEFDEMGFEPTTLPPPNMSWEEYTADWKSRLVKFFVNARKETAEKFAERLKLKLKELELGGWVEVETKCFNEVVDEIAKEITEGKI